MTHWPIIKLEERKTINNNKKTQDNCDLTIIKSKLDEYFVIGHSAASRVYSMSSWK